MKNLRTFHRFIATLLLTIFIPTLLPVNALYASNNGPNAPEAAGFEPVTATDMVNLASGDMAYVLPVMDVGGFPVTMSYHGGIPLDLESTWTGLGWNLNTGAINRSTNATPDDWNGGNAMDFIKFSDSDQTFTVNVGYGITTVYEVGVGISMSSNKGLSGSVNATAGLGESASVSASLSTTGNYSLGVSAGSGKSSAGNSFGGGMSVSGNLNGGGLNTGIGAGVQTKSGLTIGMGTSLTGNGVNGIAASLGYSNGEGYGKTLSGSGSVSLGSYSMGDYDINTSGWYIPIQVYCFAGGFGSQKVTYSLKKAYQKKGYGLLYTKNAALADDGMDNVYNDYQNKYAYGDAYDQSLPETEEEFIGDYDAEREKLNFTFAGYDGYDVNATGISGRMKPLLLQNSTIFGIGYSGVDPNSSSDPKGKLHIYNHNSGLTQKTFGQNLASDIEFYFDGQFTNNRSIEPLVPTINANATNNNLSNTLSSPAALSNARSQQGNFVEVFTNEQIRTGASNGLLNPVNLPNASRTNDKYISDGIGGYKITAPDGKVYHFSQPVYHFEQVERTVYKDNTENHVSDKRQYTAYATHWLLTAITGPDYFDVNENNVADSEDYGYWVRLDHGKWSDGYVWRSPTDKEKKEYSSNIYNKINEDDFGYYQFGRKQLYYLDKIVTPTHTAYFVKDLRYDSVGSDLNYFYKRGDFPFQGIHNYGVGSDDKIFTGEDIVYKKQMQLVLKKIVLVKNADAENFDQEVNTTQNNLQLNATGETDYVDNYNLKLNCMGGFAKFLNPVTACSVGDEATSDMKVDYNIKLNQEQNVIDVKDFESFDYTKAIKVVELDYNYNLAVKAHNYTEGSTTLSNGSPGILHNAVNPNNGKLTLKSIRFLGRDNFDYMPPYKFDYDGEYVSSGEPYVPYPAGAIKEKDDEWTLFPSHHPEQVPVEDYRMKDNWGFMKGRPEAWTMTKITTPTGASINFEHEEDDFYTEAFSRRYWADYLKFKAVRVGNTIQIEVQNENDVQQKADFSKYFTAGQRVYLDLWLCRKSRHTGNHVNYSTDQGTLDVNEANNCTVTSVQGPVGTAESKIIITSDVIVGQASTNWPFTITGGTIYGDNQGMVLGDFFSKHASDSNSHIPNGHTRGQCPDLPDCGVGCPDQWSLAYKLLSNHVPSEDTGGGLRVKSITLKDENNNKYKTRYYYNKPGTNREKGIGDYESSGITSYSPVKGTKYIPFQAELPSPGVMYENVTMEAQDESNRSLGETRYHFYVLQPVFNIFDPNIKMYDVDGTKIFEVVVSNHLAANSEYFDPAATKKIKASSIKVNVNTSLIGQIKTVETYNAAGQLMSRSEKKYLSGEALKSANIHRGSIKESFQSMKSIFTDSGTEEDPSLWVINYPVLKERLLSVASKEEYTSVLQSVTTTDIHGTSVEEYSDADEMTGVFNTVQTNKADGTRTRTTRVPAYRRYQEMGSKADNLSNKNMLSQDAMNVTTINNSPGNWNTLSATITTWNKDWRYRDAFGGGDGDLDPYRVWRKHKNFIWKDNVTADGNYVTSVKEANSYFDWATGMPLSDKWQKVSEVMRYNRQSIPLETKDINGNFAASKMADGDRKVIVSGNAMMTEMFYTGAEYASVSHPEWFDGEIQGAGYRSMDIAHTGKYSIKATDQLPFIKIDAKSSVKGASDKELRPGMYKISVWALKAGSPSKVTDVLLNGNKIPIAEVVNAGCWQQLNYYAKIEEATHNTITLAIDNELDLNGLNYYDDFRMHPISSSINSYVYDLDTDELATVLDANNMATSYKYDKAGRLAATYVETMDAATLAGGFKLTSRSKQNYSGKQTATVAVPLMLNNCPAQSYDPLQLTIENPCIGSYERKFDATVIGGSGSYSYEYKWLVDSPNGIYTNYQLGSKAQMIPYALSPCPTSGYFNKEWNFYVKVTDLVTGETQEQQYTDATTSCSYSNIGKNILDLEVSKCSQSCGPDEYVFQAYQKDPKLAANYKYEYAYYEPYDPVTGHPLSSTSLNWIDVTASGGRFCPTYHKVADEGCGGFRKVVYFTYRLTNLSTNAVTSIDYYIFYGGCTEPGVTYPTYPFYAPYASYQDDGILLRTDVNGNAVTAINVNNITN